MFVTSRRRPSADQRGAVAVLVSLVLVGVLLPAAALALDLGNVYTRNAALQQAADAAALAGAKELAIQQRASVLNLPAAMAAARETAVVVLCANRPPISPDTWQLACQGGHGWAGDGDTGNGEITFYSGVPNLDHGYQATQVAGGTALITGIRVLTPSSRVTYGLAAVFSRTGYTDLRKAATATLRTVLPRLGFAPLYTVAAEASSGWLCARDTAPPPPSSTTTAASSTTTTAASTTTSTSSSGTSSDPCTQARSYRGYLDATRSDSLQNQHRLIWNTARGLERPLAPAMDGGSCPAAGSAPTSCVHVRRSTSTTGTWSDDLMRGLFGYTATSPALVGRLAGSQCVAPDGTSGTTALGGSQVTQAPPYRAETAALRNGFGLDVPGQAGHLDPRILRCGRLAVVPQLAVTDTDLLATLSTGTYQVQGLWLLWIDDLPTAVPPSPNCWRGVIRDTPPLTGCTANASEITGFLLDPRRLPATVAGPDAGNTTGYLAAGLPATVRLIRDTSDPPTR